MRCVVILLAFLSLSFGNDLRRDVGLIGPTIEADSLLLRKTSGIVFPELPELTEDQKSQFTDAQWKRLEKLRDRLKKPLDIFMVDGTKQSFDVAITERDQCILRNRNDGTLTWVSLRGPVDPTFERQVAADDFRRSRNKLQELSQLKREHDRVVDQILFPEGKGDNVGIILSNLPGNVPVPISGTHGKILARGVVAIGTFSQNPEKMAKEKDIGGLKRNFIELDSFPIGFNGLGGLYQHLSKAPVAGTACSGAKVYTVIGDGNTIENSRGLLVFDHGFEFKDEPGKTPRVFINPESKVLLGEKCNADVGGTAFDGFRLVAPKGP